MHIIKNYTVCIVSMYVILVETQVSTSARLGAWGASRVKPIIP